MITAYFIILIVCIILIASLSGIAYWFRQHTRDLQERFDSVCGQLDHERSFRGRSCIVRNLPEGIYMRVVGIVQYKQSYLVLEDTERHIYLVRVTVDDRIEDASHYLAKRYGSAETTLIRFDPTVQSKTSSNLSEPTILDLGTADTA